jgi:hypothetical protein
VALAIELQRTVKAMQDVGGVVLGDVEELLRELAGGAGGQDVDDVDRDAEA